MSIYSKSDVTILAVLCLFTKCKLSLMQFFNKISSPQILQNYTGIISVLGKSIQTNISQTSLTNLIKQQLNDAGSWKIETTTIDGKGQTGGLTSYAMPSSRLYMFVLNQDSLTQTQTRIKTAQVSTKK